MPEVYVLLNADEIIMVTTSKEKAIAALKKEVESATKDNAIAYPISETTWVSEDCAYLYIDEDDTNDGCYAYYIRVTKHTVE